MSNKPIDSRILEARPGDEIEATFTGKGTRRYKVVQNWTKDEPKMLLLCIPEMLDGKCYTVLAEDCTFIREHIDGGY